MACSFFFDTLKAPWAFYRNALTFSYRVFNILQDLWEAWVLYRVIHANDVHSVLLHKGGVWLFDSSNYTPNTTTSLPSVGKEPLSLNSATCSLPSAAQTLSTSRSIPLPEGQSSRIR